MANTPSKKFPAEKPETVIKKQLVVVTRNGDDKEIDIKLLDHFLIADWKRK